MDFALPRFTEDATDELLVEAEQLRCVVEKLKYFGSVDDMGGLGMDV